MLKLLLAFAVVVTVATLYFASTNREFLKFLSGAFFVSAGIQYYLYLANVSVPLLGTDLIQTPGLSAVRSIIHLILFLITLYFGFIRKPAEATR
jgi:uncharacterized protein (DUF486 family)